MLSLQATQMLMAHSYAGADDIGIMQTALYAQRVRTAAAEAGVQASDTSYSSGPTGPSASTPHKLQKPCPYQTAATIFIDHVLPQHTETFVPDQQLLQTISKHLDNPLGSQQPCTPNPTSPRIQMNKPSPAASAAADRVLTRLLNIGCLARSPHHLDGHVFCVPGIGPLLKHIPSGRKELLGWLSKRRYKEAGEALLLKTKMRGAGPLPLRYLLLDLLGKGDLVRLETPGGACIRLAHR